MPFLQQQQQQSDGFQNLLGVLKANRERDAADLAAFHDQNNAVSRAARDRLISNGVISEDDTLDGMKKNTDVAVAKAAQTKAAENPNVDKAFGKGYMASKLGQQGYNEQQTFADAGNQKFLDNAKRIYGDTVALDQAGNLVWKNDAGKPSKYGLSNAQMERVMGASEYGGQYDKASGKYDPTNLRTGVDALRFAAQSKADGQSVKAAVKTAVQNRADFEKEGAKLNIPTVDNAAMARKDDADAARLAVGKVKKQSADVDKVFDAANNESGNAQYNYARGKQYIESMMPEGPERDAAISRYKEMFMQQQLVGEKGAYMGNIYDDKSKGHDGTGGAREKIATVGGGISNKSLKFNYTGYASPETMNAKAPDAFLNQWAITFYGGDNTRIPEKMKKYRDPSMWDAEDRKRYYSFDTKPLQEGLDLPAYDAEKYEQLIKRGVKPSEARAMAEIPRRKSSAPAPDDLK